MRPFRLIFASAILLLPFVAQADSDDMHTVRMPMITHNSVESESIAHLARARSLIRAAAEELRQGSHLHKWPDRDWDGMIRGLEGYDKSLDLFMFPSYRVAPYEDRHSKNKVKLVPIVASEEDSYPNGEDLPAGKH